jgi:hypothetical protein
MHPDFSLDCIVKNKKTITIGVIMMRFLTFLLLSAFIPCTFSLSSPSVHHPSPLLSFFLHSLLSFLSPTFSLPPIILSRPFHLPTPSPSPIIFIICRVSAKQTLEAKPFWSEACCLRPCQVWLPGELSLYLFIYLGDIVVTHGVRRRQNESFGWPETRWRTFFSQVKYFCRRHVCFYSQAFWCWPC